MGIRMKYIATYSTANYVYLFGTKKDGGFDSHTLYACFRHNYQSNKYGAALIRVMRKVFVNIIPEHCPFGFNTTYWIFE